MVRKITVCKFPPGTDYGEILERVTTLMARRVVTSLLYSGNMFAGVDPVVFLLACYAPVCLFGGFTVLFLRAK